MPRNTDSDIVVVRNLFLYKETDYAVLVGKPGLGRYDKLGKTFIPSSLIEHNEWKGEGTISDIEIPRWLAEDREFDYE